VFQALIIVIIALALGVSFQTGVLGVLVLFGFAAVFGLSWACLSIIIALKTKNAQATQSSFVLFFPFVFLTTAFMPEELLSGWFKVAVKVNPVTYVTEAMRVLVVEGWEWNTILTGLWVTAAMVGLLMILTTWLYRRVTA
jgi:ABC-2 type transport system permease protein